MNRIKRLFKGIIREFLADNCFQMAAALAYYTIFSLPALLVIALMVASAVYGEQAARGEIDDQVRAYIGQEAAAQVQAMIKSARLDTAGFSIASVIGLAALIFGATGAFYQLQQALNRVWAVQPDGSQGGIWNFVQKRALSLSIVAILGLLLVASLVAGTMVSAFGDRFSGVMGSGVSQVALTLLNFGLSFLIIALFFGAIYKILPDADLAWRDVIAGALGTAALFILGKYLIGLYLARAGVTSSFGAASSLALLLVWIYYSSLILLLGAEFTQVWSRVYGRPIHPARGAVHVIQAVRPVTPAEYEAHERGKEA
ncbi:MAG: YihY/virulence factor BrkB family protein [Candidatus Hydrogenedentes bacterium]|nr:YihY/virulence factor BrkB family protein [Candidatus Hydrogenedentota bacterium]